MFKSAGVMIALTVVFGLSGFLMGSMAHQLFGFDQAHDISNSNPPESSSPQLDPVNLQLIERIKDAINHLNITVAVIGIIAVLLSVASGLAIWQTRDHTIDLLDGKFIEFRSEKVEPLLNESKTELANLRSYGVTSMVYASSIIMNMVVSEYEKFLNTVKVDDEGNLEFDSENLKRDLLAQKDLTMFIIGTMSTDSDVVIDSCEKISSYLFESAPIHKLRIIQQNREFLCDHLEQIASEWPPGIEKKEIHKVINLIDKAQEEMA